MLRRKELNVYNSWSIFMESYMLLSASTSILIPVVNCRLPHWIILGNSQSISFYPRVAIIYWSLLGLIYQELFKKYMFSLNPNKRAIKSNSSSVRVKRAHCWKIAIWECNRPLMYSRFVCIHCWKHLFTNCHRSKLVLVSWPILETCRKVQRKHMMHCSN